MTTAIVVSNPVTKAVTPKPTKREVIEALVRIKMAENEETRKKNQAEAERLSEELEAAFKALVLKSPNKFTTTAYFGYRYTNDVKGCQLTFNFHDQLPELVKKKVLKYQELSNTRFPDEKRVREMIRQSIEMNGATTDDRVQALIDSPEASKALKKMLKELGV